METEFASALLAAPQPVVIGVRMRPYALGHHLLLTQIGSAFVTRDRIPLFDDLIASACICAHSWEENQKLLRSSWRRWLTLKVWGTLAGKFDIPAAVESLFDYVSKGEQYPADIDAPKGDSFRELYAPPSARLYFFLRSNGFSESEAMNMPLPCAKWLDAARAEELGHVNFISDRVKSVIDLAKGMVAA